MYLTDLRMGTVRPGSTDEGGKAVCVCAQVQVGQVPFECTSEALLFRVFCWHCVFVRHRDETRYTPVPMWRGCFFQHCEVVRIPVLALTA